MKRIRPAPMGRAYRYQRRMAHIEIALAERQAGQGAKIVQRSGGHGRSVGTVPKPRRQTKARIAARASA